jgi:hypothetical protein
VRRETIGSDACGVDTYDSSAFAAGLVGILLPFVQFGWLLLVTALSHDSRCGHFGCISSLADEWTVGNWAAVVLAWPLLHLLRVRPAWIVAVLAPFFLVPIQELAAGQPDRRSVRLPTDCPGERAAPAAATARSGSGPLPSVLRLRPESSDLSDLWGANIPFIG